MELWIRSQKKTRLIKVNNILAYDFEDGSYGIQINGECFVGEYTTEERALEVLDEIQRILQPMIKAYTPLTESKEDYKNHCMKTELVGYETTYDIVALPTYVYEMPKE